MGAIFLRSPRYRDSTCSATHLSVQMTITINSTLAYTIIKDSVANQKNLFEFAELARDYVKQYLSAATKFEKEQIVEAVSDEDLAVIEAIVKIAAGSL